MTNRDNRADDAADRAPPLDSERGADPENTETGKAEFDAQRRTLAEAFGRTTDPLVELEPTFEEVDVDVFGVFLQDVLDQQNPDDDTRYQYEMTFRQWSAFMNQRGRHPACPNEDHVMAFIDHELAPENAGGKGNHPRTVKEKLRKLNRAYEYWQGDAAFPHPMDYNPFEAAREKRRAALTPSDERKHRRITLDEMQNVVRSVTDIRRRTLICLQLKLGLRAGEVSNIQLADINLTNAELARHYPELGTNPNIAKYKNAIYIPPSKERDGNKSKRPRVLPLDDETRLFLLQYLLIRPDAGEPWVFLSKKTHTKIDKKIVNKEWRAAFSAARFDETEKFKAVTSHFGRHWFTTHWRVQENVPRELVQYMRGDKLGEGARNHRDAIDTYLHAYYEDIKDLYLERIYKLNI